MTENVSQSSTVAGVDNHVFQAGRDVKVRTSYKYGISPRLVAALVIVLIACSGIVIYALTKGGVEVVDATGQWEAKSSRDAFIDLPTTLKVEPGGKFHLVIMASVLPGLGITRPGTARECSGVLTAQRDHFELHSDDEGCNTMRAEVDGSRMTLHVNLGLSLAPSEQEIRLARN